MVRVLCITLSLLLVNCVATKKFQEIYNWRELDWAYPEPQMYQEAVLSGDLVRQNGLPVGIERWQNKLFVTVPRWRVNGEFY